MMIKNFAVLFSLTLASASAFAAPFNDAAPAPALTITSQNLDEILFANNPDSIRAMNAVMKARDQVSIARAGVLPSLNLNVVMTLANPPMFLINSVSCLVPFLFPSAWYDLSAARAGHGAEIMAFHIARLNAYSTAFALAEQVGGDSAILKTREAHFARVKEYVDNLKLQAQLGIIPQSDAIRGELDLGKMELMLSQLRQLVGEERAAIRKLFGFTLAQKFEIAMETVPPSDFEDKIPESTLSAIVARAPERLQINSLIAQANAQVHSAQWAWLGGCQGNQGNFGSGTGAGAFSVATGFSINIGFGYYPRILLAKRNVQDMINRQNEQTLELARVLETSVGDIHELKLRKTQADANLAMAERLLDEQNHLMESGQGSAQATLQAYEQISQSTVDAQTAQIGLDGHRVTLKRVALEDGFLKVFINSRRLLEFGQK